MPSEDQPSLKINKKICVSLQKAADELAGDFLSILLSGYLLNIRQCAYSI